MAATSIHSINTTLVRALAYISNEGKTEDGTLIRCFGCRRDPDLAAKDFESTSRAIGTGRGKIVAQHMIISFKPNEITPEKAMMFGQRLCSEYLKDQYQYMLAVHTDRKHIHCHIVFNNTNMENGKSFKTLSDRKSDPDWLRLRKMSDDLCKEYQLSVIKSPEKNKGKSWYEWDKNRQGLSWKTQLKFAIDECIMNSNDFSELLQNIRERGIEISYNPEHKIDLKFRMKGQQKWSRSKTLGWYYETPQLKRRIEEYRAFISGQSIRHKRTSIIDTSSERFENAKGLEKWADIQNMKEASRVINILTERNISSINDIEKVSIQDFSDRVKLVNDLNDIQHEIDTLSETISNLRKYKKYKSINSEFKSQKTEKSKRKYAEKYAPELEKYKAASAFLKNLYPDGNVPSEEKLSVKKNSLIEKRNDMNERYKSLQAQIKDLDFARQTINDYLKNERKELDRKRTDLE